MVKQKQAQEYDNTLKVLFGKEAAQILPRLMPGTELLDEKNVEIDRSQLRADLVYTVKYLGRWHILNVELQTSVDKNMHYRLLQYHVGLHAKYKKPVLSVVLYPFASNVPKPPYRELGGNGVLLTWDYRVIVLYLLEAEPFIRESVMCMYSMLPAMKGVTVEMLERALREMERYYSQEEMKHHLALFWRMLQKSRTLNRQEKEQIGEIIKMEFNWWIDTNPEIKKRIARAAKEVAREAVKEAVKEAKKEARKEGIKEGIEEGIKEGMVEGKAEGELGALRQAVLNVVQRRFPAQLSLAQQYVSTVSKIAQLHQLLLDLVDAPDETAVMLLLADDGSKQLVRRKK